MIKEKMDETFGGSGYWNVVVGESFEVMRKHFSLEKINILL